MASVNIPDAAMHFLKATVGELYSVELHAALTKSKADQMAKLQLEYPEWKYLDILSTNQDEIEVVLNPILRFVELRESWNHHIPQEGNARLRSDDPENLESLCGEKRYLYEHPIACRSFGFFPIVQNVSFHAGDHTSPDDITNTCGITTWDIVGGLKAM